MEYSNVVRKKSEEDMWTLFTINDLDALVEKEKKLDDLVYNDSIKANNCYWKRNLFPLIIEIALCASYFIVPKQYYLYTTFFFYLILFAYFSITRLFSFTCLKKYLNDGKYFWLEVILVALFFILAILGTCAILDIIPSLKTEIVTLGFNTPFEMVLFLATSVFLAPITDEVFFRRNLIYTKNNSTLVLTVTFSVCLYALTRAVTPAGIFLAIIWAVPLSITYIMTKNIYLTMTAHFLVNVLGVAFGFAFGFIGM